MLSADVGWARWGVFAVRRVDSQKGKGSSDGVLGGYETSSSRQPCVAGPGHRRVPRVRSIAEGRVWSREPSLGWNPAVLGRVCVVIAVWVEGDERGEGGEGREARQTGSETGRSDVGGQQRETRETR